MIKVWIIYWNSIPDGAKSGFVKIYRNKENAFRDLQLLKTHAVGREFKLNEVETEIEEGL